MNFRFKPAAVAAVITILTGTAGVSFAGQGSAGDGTSAVTELLRLLQAKGVVTSGEAKELEKKFSRDSAVSDDKKGRIGRGPEGNTVKMPVASSADEKVRETISFLVEQGIISGDEKAELYARADVIKRRGRGQSVPERRRSEVGAGAIDYGNTTATVGEIRDKLRFLAYQKVMTRDEAAGVYRRFGENYTAAENGGGKAAAVAREEKTENDDVQAGGTMDDETATSGYEQPGGKAPFVYGEVVENIDSLADQGIIGDRETDELKERADLLNRGNRIEQVAGKKRLSVGRGEIPYRRTDIDIDEVKDDLKFLTYQGVMTQGESTAAFARFEKKYPTDKLVENVSNELSWEVRSQVAEKMDRVAELERKDARLPEWLDRINMGGDFRLRYERDFFNSDNSREFLDPSNPSQLLNSFRDQNFVKIRGRLNLTARVNDKFQAGIGLATGNTNNPVSTNATLGTSLNKQNFILDLAYLKWTPAPDLTFWGGRFTNPWFHTDLVWDPDINFDGVAFNYRPKITDSLDLFLTGGAFPIQSMSLTSSSKWLYAGQLGARVKPADSLIATVGAAFYDFEHTVGVLNSPSSPAGTTDWSAPQFQQKGNTVFYIDPTNSNKLGYASAFRELNITGMVDAAFWNPVHVIFTADYVKNLGFDSHDVELRATALETAENIHVRKEAEGFQLGLTVGYPTVRKFAEWKGFLFYKYLGSDAVMDAFTDSDFHLGGTNAKGWILGGEFGIARNVWLCGKWFSTNEISGPPFGIDTFFLDLNANF